MTRLPGCTEGGRVGESHRESGGGGRPTPPCETLGCGASYRTLEKTPQYPLPPDSLGTDGNAAQGPAPESQPGLLCPGLTNADEGPQRPWGPGRVPAGCALRSADPRPGPRGGACDSSHPPWPPVGLAMGAPAGERAEGGPRPTARPRAPPRAPPPCGKKPSHGSWPQPHAGPVTLPLPVPAPRRLRLPAAVGPSCSQPTTVLRPPFCAPPQRPSEGSVCFLGGSRAQAH